MCTALRAYSADSELGAQPQSGTYYKPGGGGAGGTLLSAPPRQRFARVAVLQPPSGPGPILPLTVARLPEEPVFVSTVV
jgi:hypothetical protein